MEKELLPGYLKESICENFIKELESPDSPQVLLWRKIINSKEHYCSKCKMMIYYGASSGVSEALIDKETVAIPCYCGNTNKFKVSEHL